MNLLVRLGNYISTKPNFLNASVVGFGLPLGILLAFITSEYGPVGPVIALLLAVPLGYLWGLAMWHLLFKSICARRTSQPPTGTSE